MADAADIALRHMEENWAQARQSEDQRATISNIVVTVASLAHGALALTGFSEQALPLTVFLVVLGFYGFIASAKLYERNRLHVEVAVAVRSKLEEICPEASVSKIIASARQAHQKENPFWSQIRLNRIWLALHLLVAILGVVYTLIIWSS